jgi:hypothetical protein
MKKKLCSQNKNTFIWDQTLKFFSVRENYFFPIQIRKSKNGHKKCPKMKGLFPNRVKNK